MVAPLGIPNKQAWECALLTCLRDEIRSGNLAVTGSKRYGRFDHFFILDTEWEQIRQEFFQRAQLPLLRQNRRRGLLKGEQIHQLARNVAYGKRGKISVRELHEQKNTCSCLTLILSSIIYWQASEIKHIIDQYGHEFDQKCLSMLSHISPIGWDNIILYGEYVLDKRLIK